MRKKAGTATEHNDHVAVFQKSSILRVWQKERLWFSVTDVCVTLTASPDTSALRRKFKRLSNAAGGQPVTLCCRLKFQARGGDRSQGSAL